MVHALIRIATRKSPLALWQAQWVAGELEKYGHSCRLVPLISSGDGDLRPISATAEVGMFTKRIQQAVMDGDADVAVHSLKDLPTQTIDELQLTATPLRAPVEDCLISRAGWSLDQLPPGALVGTSSRRRAAQLLHLRPDLRIRPIRGNVQTRLDQVMGGKFDATILASAGLQRLDLPEVPFQTLPIAVMLPAPGQGALAIEVRSDDATAIAATAVLDDPATRASVTAERSLLRHLSGGCLAPIAAYGRAEGSRLLLSAVVLSADGTERLETSGEGEVTLAADLGQRAADTLLDAGAERLIASAR